MSWEALVSVARDLYRRSAELWIPAISPADGFILSALAFTVCSGRGYVNMVDAGAGIGFSTLFIAYGASRGCRGRLVAVEMDEGRFEELKRNTRILRDITGDSVAVEAVLGDALEYLDSVEDESLDLVFVDIEKSLYPEAARILKGKLRRGGIAVFHNAIQPKPPREFFEIVSKEFNSITIPTEAGILVAIKER